MVLPALRNSKLAAEAGLVYAAAIWGSTFFVVKAALNHVDPLLLVALRFTLAAVVLGAWLLIKRRPLFKDFRAGLLLGVILGVLYASQSEGLLTITASNSGFITGLFIVFVPFLAWLLYRRRTRRRHLLAAAVALAGLWLLTGGIAGMCLGDLLTLASAITYALHVLLAGEYMRRRLDPYVLNFQQILITAAFGWLLVLALHRPLAVSQAGVWWVILFLALFPTLSAFAVQLLAQRVVTAQRAALIFILEPVFAALFAWGVGGEGLVPLRAVGGLLIVAAMFLSELRLGSGTDRSQSEANDALPG